jgi:uncharacterized membrane protein (TIGR01666 family)
MIKKILRFSDSTSFTNALKVTIASVFPVLLFSYFNLFQTGFTIAIGAFLTYPSDIPSNLKHKINGIIVTAIMIASINLIINYVYPYPSLFYPILACLLFFLAMISVYGQRATLVSFSTLIAVSLAFAHLNTGWEIVIHSGLLFLGGIFYLAISLLFYYVRPHRYIELQIAECIGLSAKYLKLRGDLWTLNSNKKEIIENQLHLQVELNTIHQNIRETLIGNHVNSNSSEQNRKMLIVFVSLVEILELALSTSFDHDKLHKKFDSHPKVLLTYQNLAYSLAKTLKQISKSVEDKTKYVSTHSLFENLSALELAINDYANNLGKDYSSEGVFMLTTMLEYAEKQLEKIKTVERAFTSAITSQDFKGKDKDLEKFLTPQYYPWSTFFENLSFSSTIFRHSLRLTVTIMIGFIISKILPFQNVHWILLTIVVIMRPGYGLTKERSYDRTLGTIIGGSIAFVVISLTNNNITLSTLAILSILLGFTFTAINYKISATFVTMYVVFIYSILDPNISNVIQYRIIDTLVGATLAFIANYYLWPSWEFLNVQTYLEKAIQANRNYLMEISTLYNKKGEITTPYRLARKNAFIETGNLMASFQRMSQEPKSKQKQLQEVYRLAVLNHTLLSSTASMGTYIQSHKTTSASEAFNAVVNTVIKNLDESVSVLKDEKHKEQKTTDQKDLANRFTELKNIRKQELKSDENLNEAAYLSKMQEAQLVIEQLIWLNSLSENILKSSKMVVGS